MVWKNLVDIQAQQLADEFTLVDYHVHVRPGALDRVGGAIGHVKAAFGLHIKATHPLTPGCRGQDYISIKIIGRILVDILNHREHLRESRSGQVVGIGQVDVGGINHKHRLHLALEGALHHPDSHPGILHAGGLVQTLLRDAPSLGAPGPMRRIVQPDIKREPTGQSAGQALAHGVGLAGL